MNLRSLARLGSRNLGRSCGTYQTKLPQDGLNSYVAFSIFARDEWTHSPIYIWRKKLFYKSSKLIDARRYIHVAILLLGLLLGVARQKRRQTNWHQGICSKFHSRKIRIFCLWHGNTYERSSAVLLRRRFHLNRRHHVPSVTGQEDVGACGPCERPIHHPRVREGQHAKTAVAHLCSTRRSHSLVHLFRPNKNLFMFITLFSMCPQSFSENGAIFTRIWTCITLLVQWRLTPSSSMAIRGSHWAEQAF